MVETEFPGGNGIVESMGEDSIHLSPDNRNGRPWFYWHIAVKGVGGRTVEFVLKPEHVGVAGPGVSLDRGMTWEWLGADAVKEGVFHYTFEEDADVVHFSVGMPYVSAQLDKFLSGYEGNSFIERKVLTKSGKGRDVPLLLLSGAERKAKYAVALLARNHSSEMMGSYVLEGIMTGILAEDERGKWLREHVDFFIVPFVDMDGVEEGDQGKNRNPHDHNRDYGENSMYSEVITIKEQLPAWSAGRPLVFLDIHDPALKGDIHEVVQFLEGTDAVQNEQLYRFLDLARKEQQGLILMAPSMVMKHGSGYNRMAEDPPPHASGWGRTIPGVLFGATLEMPYARANGFEVNMKSAREFGHDLSWGLQAYFEELEEKSTP